MACIDKIYSVSAVIGDGSCNANCAFCAGKTLGRGQRNAQLHKQNMRNLKFAIKLSARHGGWSLSLTSAGEPTCDPLAVTEALSVYRKCADDGAFMPNVNLFTNGIKLGDETWCDEWLPTWKKLGLTNVAVSIHSASTFHQASTYGVDAYPMYSHIVRNCKKHGIGVRATLLLRRGAVDTPEAYFVALSRLIECGFENITSWPVGNPDGSRNKFTPSWLNLLRIKWALSRQAKLAHGHMWGGGVYDYNGTIVRITDYVTKHDPDKDFVRQLVVLQDGGVYYSWIKEGAICQKG
jgi:sulfatase maturation enzyme AslB (radical SAM superfamily)